MSDRKRLKTTNNEILNTTSITKFEQLPNELILMCFHYFDFYHIYEMFYHLNRRLNHLIQYETKMHIDVNSIPSKKFLTFFLELNKLTTTRQNCRLSITADDHHKLDLLLEDEIFKETFSKIKSLTLSNMDAKTIYSMIFDKTIKLYQTLERLSLLGKITSEFVANDDINHLCNSLMSSKMESLKKLKLDFAPDWSGCECDWYMRPEYIYLEFSQIVNGEKSFSHLETIVIGNISGNCDSSTRIRFHTLIEHLLPCLPELKTLTINSIYLDNYDYIRRSRVSSTTTTNSILPLNLKVVKVWFSRDRNTEDNIQKYLDLVRSFFISNTSSDIITIDVSNILQ